VKTLEGQLAEYCEYQSEVHGPISTNEIHRSIASEAGTQAAAAIGPSWKRVTRPVWVAVTAAVAIFILIGGVAWLNWSRGRESGPVITQAPVPTSTPTTVVTQVVPEESADVVPETAEPTPPITGMAWQQFTPDGIDPTLDAFEGELTYSGVLVSGGDRFLYVDRNGGNVTVAESFDGANWSNRSIPGSVDGLGRGSLVGWQDTLVATGCGETFYDLHPEPRRADSQTEPLVGAGRITSYPSCVSVIRPDDTVSTRLFDANIQAVGIGSAGMFAIGTDQYDENGLLYVAEVDLVTVLTGREIWADFDDSLIELIDGVLHIEFRDGQVNDYVLADHGYALEPADYHAVDFRAASGWFSQDGAEWIPVPDFPARTNGWDWKLIGTEDGFIAISNNRDGHVVAWHSPNGLDWRELGPLPDDGATLSRWNDGAVVIGTERVWHLSAAGIEETPLAAPGPGELGIVMSTSGEIGVAIFIFRAEDEGEAMELKQVLYSSDGQAWTNTEVSPEMRETPPNLGEWPWFHHVDLATTDTSVLLYLRSDGGDVVDPASAWFLGVPITD